MVRTRDLLIKIGVENSLPINKIEEIVEKLESEWYSSSEHLLELTESDWKKLQIPTRLINLIKKYLSEDLTCLESVRQDSLSKLFSTLQPLDLAPCISALQQICFNLSTYTDAKYQSLNPNNPTFHQKIGRFPTALQYLKHLGFQQNSSKLSTQNPDQSFFLSELEAINKLALAHNLPEKQPPEKFNPFKASFSTTNFLVSKVAEGQNNFKSISKEIERIRENREKAVKSIRIDRDPKIYRLGEDGARILDASINEDNEFEEELIRKNVQSIMLQREKSMTFQNKRRNELEKIMGQEFCAKVGVKIRFPDGFILEGNFSLKETVNDVYEFVRGYLADRKEFYLFITPPKVVVKENSEILQKFMPAVLLQFSWSDESRTRSYLRGRS